MATTRHSRSKPDTVLLLDFAAGNDEVDYSQYRTDLTNNTTYLSEATSARVAFDPTVAGREIYVAVNVTSGETGTLIALTDPGDSSTHSWKITIEATDTIRCYENGSVVVEVASPTLTVSDRNVRIGWHQHPDGDDVRSELIVYVAETGSVAFAAATHSPTTPDAGYTLTVGAGLGGADTFAGGISAFTYARIGRRYHSPAEWREDNINTTTPPSPTQTRRGAPLVPDRSTITIADDGYLTGPAHLWAGHVFEECDRRLVGPLVNTRPVDPLQIEYTFDMDTSAWWRSPVDLSAYRLCIAYLWRRPVSPKVNRAHCRVRCRMNNSSAATVAEARLVVYSMSGLPVAGQPAVPLIWRRTAQGTRSTDDGTTAVVGGWIDLGALELVVGDDGYTWLAVGVDFDDGDAQVANTELFIPAVTIDPYHEPSDTDGGMGPEDP